MPFYELRLEPPPGLEIAALAYRVDQTLCELNIEYGSKRKSGRLGAIQAVPLSPGTLEQAELQRIASRRGRNEQYKHQYLLTEIVPS